MRLVFAKIKNKEEKRRLRRKLSVRKKINGTGERPRVCVIKSNANLQICAVDDAISSTICSVRTFGKKSTGQSANAESAKIAGTEFALLLKKHGINKVVFDRNGRQYTGVVRTVAEAIRTSGIVL
jgi:large subunit ribosomal protein L18